MKKWLTGANPRKPPLRRERERSAFPARLSATQKCYDGELPLMKATHPTGRGSSTLFGEALDRQKFNRKCEFEIEGDTNRRASNLMIVKAAR
jgi:hypothetical protein